MPGDRLRASPLARKMAAEAGIDLAEIRGSGPGGRIVEADLPSGARATAPAPAPDRPEAQPAPASPAVASLTLERSVGAATFRLFQKEFEPLAPTGTAMLLQRAVEAALSETDLLGGRCALLDPETLDGDGAASVALCDLTDHGVALFAPPLVAPFAAVLGAAAPEPDRLTLTLTADASALPPATAARLLAAIAGRIAHPAQLFV